MCQIYLNQMKKWGFWIRDLRDFLFFELTPLAKDAEEDSRGKRCPKSEDQKSDPSAGLSTIHLFQFC